MAHKGNGKWGKGPPAWAQKTAKEDMLKGRKLVSDSRFVGSICEWHRSWGWIEPLTEVSHAQIKKNKGRIYVNRSDTRSAVRMDVGTKLDFQIYCDARGLGAVDCVEVQAVAVKAAAAVAAADDEADLPEGWEKHWSAEHSEYFYWNQLTKETSWVPPRTVSEKDTDDPLPQGWAKEFDSENQEWYYWDKVNKKASWDRPEAPAKRKADQQVGGRGSLEKKAKLEGVASVAPVLGQQRVRGRVVEWHGFYGSILPLQELSEDLRPLLQLGEGKIYLNWRDVHPGLEMEVEMEVDFMLYEDDNGLAASDVRLPGQAKAVGSKQAALASSLGNRWAQEDEATAGDEDEAAAAAEQGDDEENEGPLLPGWEQVWSDEHQRHYYWHKAAKIAAWERPSLPAEDGEQEAEERLAEGEDKVWDGEGLESVTSHKATPMTPLVSSATRAMTPATPGVSQARGNHAAPNTTPFRGREGGSMQNLTSPGGKGPLRKAPTAVGGSGFGSKVGGTIKPLPSRKEQPRRYLQAFERY